MTASSTPLRTVSSGSPRIPMLSEADALAIGREMGVDDYICKMNLFRVLLNHPTVAKELNSTIISLVSGDKELDDRLREIIVMRISWLACCDYEWTQHWQVSLIFGIAEEELEAIKHWTEANCFTEPEQAVLQATDDILTSGTVGAETWKKLQKNFTSNKTLIEVVICIGNWNMFAQILRAFDIPLEEGLDSWPPNGQGPEALSS